LSVAGPLLVNHVWSKIKTSPLVLKARAYLKNYLGIDTNDYPSRGFTIQPQQNASWTTPDDISYRYDAVCTQAVCSMLFPELTCTRIPSDVALKTGLLNKTEAFTITTNASGAAAVVFYPQNFDGSFYRIYN